MHLTLMVYVIQLISLCDLFLVVGWMREVSDRIGRNNMNLNVYIDGLLYGLGGEWGRDAGVWRVYI